MLLHKKKRKRVILIGLDGVPYRLIRNLSSNGTMPNLGTIIQEGIFRQMESSIPEVSSVAWSSIITGKNPAEHGIFGFTDLAPNTYRTVFPNFNNLQAPPFWEQPNNRRSIIINVPSTYPARRLNGVLIAGFVALDLEKATYPPSLVPQLKSFDYRIDVDSQRVTESIDFFFKDLDKTLNARIAAYRYLWHKEQWQTFMLVFTGTDRLSHFLWDAYENKSHKYHAAFLDYFHKIDEVVGEIANQLEDDDVIILLSDHGFELLEKEIYINFILKQEGFLKFNWELPSGLKDIGNETKAFALDPARVYLNLKGKYPQGSVEPQEQEAIIRDLEEIFNTLEINGAKVIRRCYRKEEIYKGPFLDRAPDLVLVANEGFNLRAGIKTPQLWGTDIRTGKHTQHDAFLLMRGKFDEEIIPQKPYVTDIVPIINQLTGGQYEITQRKQNVLELPSY